MSALQPPRRGINPHPYRAWIDGSLRFGTITHRGVDYIPIVYAIILINEITWSKHDLESFYILLRNIGIPWERSLAIVGGSTYIPISIVMSLIEDHPNQIQDYAQELTTPDDSVC